MSKLDFFLGVATKIGKVQKENDAYTSQTLTDVDGK
jgi:hypothetical protein